MVNQDILNSAKNSLKDITDVPSLEARILLASVMKSDTAPFTKEATEAEKVEFIRRLGKRIIGTPLAYIVDEKEFMSLKFEVNESVLIPRPDTECLAEFIIDTYKDKSVKILDVCSGSGCIGISIAHYLKDSYVTMLDISGEAIDISRKNILHNKVTKRVFAKKLDVLKEELPLCFDVIVSNPPYIKSDVLKTLDVSKHEPILALDGGEDGLVFYREIVKKAYSSLNKGGMLAVEIGFDQKDEVSEIFNNYFKSSSSLKDLAGNDRIVWAKK